MILAVFLLRPEFPTRLRAALDANSQNMPAELNSGNGHGLHLAGVEPASQSQSEDAFDPNQLMDVDEEFVRYLAAHKYRLNPGNIRRVMGTQLIAVNQYRLEDGQLVSVYTPIANRDWRESE